MLRSALVLLLGAAACLHHPANAQTQPPDGPFASECRVEPVKTKNPGWHERKLAASGALKKVVATYDQGGQYNPYSTARVVGTRIGPLSMGRNQAIDDAKFLLATMVLDAGFRWFEPSIHIGKGAPGDDQLVDAFVNLVGGRNARHIEVWARFCDGRTEAANDAVEVHNRLGAKLLGARFAPRSAPAARKMTRQYAPATRF